MRLSSIPLFFGNSRQEIYMVFIKNLRELDIIHNKYVGRKAANLGKLMSNNISVPNGFVITNNAYYSFIEENNIRENKSLYTHCDKALLRKSIIEGLMPLKIKNDIISAYISLSTATSSSCVAVRSSATFEDLEMASFAGQMDTYLNISGEDDLIRSIQKIYASLWGDNVAEYRAKKNMFQDDGIAIIVQQMIKCDVSGVLFTRNPITGNRGEVMINAAYGLGEAIVSGHVSPDEYICDKNGTTICALLGRKETQITYIDRTILEMPVAKHKQQQFALDELSLKKLTSIGFQIEKLFKVPMDIEWGLKDGEIFILQARPITTIL